MDALLPQFEQTTGYKVKPITVGSGEALSMAEMGEVDVLLTHSPSAEQNLVDSNRVINYQLVMHNDFVIVGPSNDPAKIKGMPSAAEAVKAIAATNSLFVSRGDESGTHLKEMDLWKTANMVPKGTWYQETGSGMGQTLAIASDKNGYTITDRGTYLATKRNLKLQILVEGDPSLLNIYHVMQVNPDKYPKVNADGGKALVDFMLHPNTQKLIAEFGQDQFGESLFFPDAGKTIKDLGKQGK